MTYNLRSWTHGREITFHFLWKWQATTPSNMSLRWARWRQMGHTKNSSQYLQSTKNITWPRWFHEAKMIIDLPWTHNSFISQMKPVEQHDYDLVCSHHAVWHRMPDYNLHVSINKSNKQWDFIVYCFYKPATVIQYKRHQESLNKYMIIFINLKKIVR